MAKRYVALDAVKQEMDKLLECHREEIKKAVDEKKDLMSKVAQLREENNGFDDQLKLQKDASRVAQEKLVEEMKERTAAHESEMQTLKEEMESKIHKLKEDMREQLERNQKEHHTEMEKTRGQLSQTMKRCPPIRVWVRLTIPLFETAKPTSEPPQCVSSEIAKDGKTLTFLDESYPLNHVFGTNNTTEQIFEKLKPFLHAVREENRHLILFAYGESGAGKSGTLIDGVPEHAGKDAQKGPSLLKLITNFFLPSKKPTQHTARSDNATPGVSAEHTSDPSTKGLHEKTVGNAGATSTSSTQAKSNRSTGVIARLNGYHYISFKMRHLNSKSDAKIGDQHVGKELSKPHSIGKWAYLGPKAAVPPKICPTRSTLLKTIKEFNELRVTDETDLNTRSSRDHGWYELHFSKSEAPKGAVTIFDLAGLEDLGEKERKNGLGNSLVAGLNSLKEPLRFVGGESNGWDPESEKNLFVQFISDMLLGCGAYTKYRRPNIVVLGHVAITEGHEDKSKTTLERLSSWIDPAAEIDVDLEV